MKWTVRFGLLIVPVLVFMSGGVVLFFTPSEYESSTAVEIKQGHRPRKIPVRQISFETAIAQVAMLKIPQA